jgi:hypothetical protein
VHNGRHDREVEQRLRVKEGGSKRRPVDEAVERRSGREHERYDDEQRRDERQRFIRVLPGEHGGHVDRRGHREPAEVDPSQDAVRVENRLATGVVGVTGGTSELSALQIARK